MPMKMIRVFCTVVLLYLISGFNLYGEELTSPNKELRDYVISLVDKPVFDLFDHNKQEVALIQFTINSKNEIVVLTVDTGNEELEDYIKMCLNYKETTIPGLAINEPYILKVNFVNKNKFKNS